MHSLRLHQDLLALNLNFLSIMNTQHNIIQIHKSAYVGLTIFHVVFPDIPHIQSECGEYSGILRGILSVPQIVVMDLNNVM